MGPGTKDEHVVPPAHRAPVTRKTNLVVAGGVVRGMWLAKGSGVEVTWFEENGAPPRKALEEQVDRLAATTAEVPAGRVTIVARCALRPPSNPSHKRSGMRRRSLPTSACQRAPAVVGAGSDVCFRGCAAFWGGQRRLRWW